MQNPILNALLDDKALKQLLQSWPEHCVDAHGPLERLPAPLQADILKSIPTLTEAYQGHLNALDSRQGYEMMAVPDGTANAVLEKGATAYLEDVSPLLDDAAIFAKNLELELGIEPESAKLGAFISAAGNGAPTHYDVLDVISIQLVGTKQFYIAPLQQIRNPFGMQYCEAAPMFDELYPQISNGFPSYREQDFTRITMQPGSVLFMPRGTWHYTEAETDSMAMSIVLSPPTQVEFFLYQLKSALLQDPAWRAPCYRLGKAQGVDTKLYNKLPNIIYRLAKNHQNPQSPIRSFHKDSRYLRNPDIEVQINPGSEFHEVVYATANPAGEPITVRMEVSAEIAEVFQWLATTQGPFTVGECMKLFPTMTPEVMQELFRRAGESGLLHKLWFVALQ